MLEAGFTTVTVVPEILKISPEIAELEIYFPTANPVVEDTFVILVLPEVVLPVKETTAAEEVIYVPPLMEKAAVLKFG